MATVEVHCLCFQPLYLCDAPPSISLPATASRSSAHNTRIHTIHEPRREAFPQISKKVVNPFIKPFIKLQRPLAAVDKAPITCQSEASSQGLVPVLLTRI